jgi:hypothetical protein
MDYLCAEVGQVRPGHLVVAGLVKGIGQRRPGNRISSRQGLPGILRYELLGLLGLCPSWTSAAGARRGWGCLGLSRA